MSIRILIADDHSVLRAGLRTLLNDDPELELVGEATDGDETIRLAGELRPDIILLDIAMPGPDGIEVSRRMKEMLPETRVLILTVYEEEGLLQEAFQAGVAGYITKRAAASELINAIHAVSRGHLYVHPSMTRGLMTQTAYGLRLRRSLVPGGSPAEPLTPRERRVLRFVAQGYTNSQIAELLTVSVRTVHRDRAKLMAKLGLHTRVELVRYAKEHFLL